MVSLGEKLKWPKPWAKRFYKHVRVVLCKNRCKKRQNIGEIRPFLKSAILQRVQTLQKWSVWVENSNGEKRAKNDSTSTLELFCAKNRWKKHQIFQKWDHFENRPSCKGYRLAKWSAWLKNSNGQKGKRNDSTSRLELFCAKNRWKKHQIFEKWDHFKNRPSCKGKGHLAKALCKMVSFGQKFKWPKHAKNDLQAR